MIEWKDYGDCCRLVAKADPSAGYCPSCRHALLRCAAPGCEGLLPPLGHCAECINIRLSLEKGAVLKARLGECLSVPFVLENNGRPRSLSIKSVLRDGTDLPQEVVPVPWDQLEAGHARSFAVATGPFAHSGINSLRLTVIVAAALGDAEETYVFSGDVALDIAGADPTHVQTHVETHVHQDFTKASFIAHDALAAVSQAASLPGDRSRQADALGERKPIVLERAERYEIEHGYRGYDRSALRIPRNVEFVYAGFTSNDKPFDGPLCQSTVVRCGRNARVGQALQNVEPNDLCLRIYDPASGDLDREASTGISRRVCDLILANDRLNVRAVTGAGLAVNGERLGAGETRVLCSGDSLVVPAGSGKTLSLGTTFKVSAGLVTHVRVEKGS